MHLLLNPCGARTETEGGLAQPHGDPADHFEKKDPGMHQTNTVDYSVVYDGEIWLELDDGETVHLKRGDVVVQNGTRHTWRNKGTEPVLSFPERRKKANDQKTRRQDRRRHRPEQKGLGWLRQSFSSKRAPTSSSRGPPPEGTRRGAVKAIGANVSGVQGDVAQPWPDLDRLCSTVIR